MVDPQVSNGVPIRPLWCAAPRAVHRAFLLAFPALILLVVASVAIGAAVGGALSVVVIIALVGVFFVPFLLATQSAGTLTMVDDILYVRWLGRVTRVPLADVERWRRVPRRLELSLAGGRTIWLLPQRFVGDGEPSGWLPDPEALEWLAVTLTAHLPDERATKTRSPA